jgi:hypothetical protein
VTVVSCSTAYEAGQVASVGVNVVLAVVTGGADAEADAAVAEEATQLTLFDLPPHTTVFRVLRPEEDPAAGLFPKDPSSTRSLDYHVRYGSGPGVRTRFISTTALRQVAVKWATKDGRRIAVIDLSKVQGGVYDLTIAANRRRYLTNPVARNFAQASAEVVIEGTIPADAIVLVYDPLAP